MRSLATRRQNLATSAMLARRGRRPASAAGFDLVIVETAGIGQSDTEIVDLADVSLYVMTAEYGAATQLEKIDMLDFADVVVDQQVRQARRATTRCATCASSGGATTTPSGVADDEMPVYRDRSRPSSTTRA